MQAGLDRQQLCLCSCQELISNVLANDGIFSCAGQQGHHVSQLGHVHHLKPNMYSPLEAHSRTAISISKSFLLLARYSSEGFGFRAYRLIGFW